MMSQSGKENWSQLPCLLISLLFRPFFHSETWMGRGKGNRLWKREERLVNFFSISGLLWFFQVTLERLGNPRPGKLWLGFPTSGWQQWPRAQVLLPSQGRGTLGREGYVSHLHQAFRREQICFKEISLDYILPWSHKRKLLDLLQMWVFFIAIIIFLSSLPVGLGICMSGFISKFIIFLKNSWRYASQKTGVEREKRRPG